MYFDKFCFDKLPTSKSIQQKINLKLFCHNFNRNLSENLSKNQSYLYIRIGFHSIMVLIRKLHPNSLVHILCLRFFSMIGAGSDFQWLESFPRLEYVPSYFEVQSSINFSTHTSRLRVHNGISELEKYFFSGINIFDFDDNTECQRYACLNSLLGQTGTFHISYSKNFLQKDKNSAGYKIQPKKAPGLSSFEQRTFSKMLTFSNELNNLHRFNPEKIHNLVIPEIDLRNFTPSNPRVLSRSNIFNKMPAPVIIPNTLWTKLIEYKSLEKSKQPDYAFDFESAAFYNRFTNLFFSLFDFKYLNCENHRISHEVAEIYRAAFQHAYIGELTIKNFRVIMAYIMVSTTDPCLLISENKASTSPYENRGIFRFCSKERFEDIDRFLRHHRDFDGLDVINHPECLDQINVTTIAAQISYVIEKTREFGFNQKKFLQDFGPEEMKSGNLSAKAKFCMRRIDRAMAQAILQAAEIMEIAPAEYIKATYGK